MRFWLFLIFSCLMAFPAQADDPISPLGLCVRGSAASCIQHFSACFDSNLAWLECTWEVSPDNESEKGKVLKTEFAKFRTQLETDCAQQKKPDACNLIAKIYHFGLGTAASKAKYRHYTDLRCNIQKNPKCDYTPPKIPQGDQIQQSEGQRQEQQQADPEKQQPNR